jgi:hypothetical protein
MLRTYDGSPGKQIARMRSSTVLDPWLNAWPWRSIGSARSITRQIPNRASALTFFMKSLITP